uniref:Kelch-like protein 10 n=1 Tax=Gouania willdenowi TaxID=441366 RepID=A0A8C5DPP3_GOUWI
MNNRVLNTAEYYNPDTNQWTLITPMGTPRYRLGVVAYMGHIFAVGGSDGNRVLNTAEYYNPDTNQWTLITPMGTHRYKLGVVAYMGHIFAVGGSDGSRDLSSAEAYDPVTNTWYDVPEMVHRHSYFAGKHVDIKYHFIRSSVNNGDITLVYCPTNKMVADVLTKPATKCNTVFLGRCFYIVGSGLRWTDPCNRVWRYNLVTHTWQEMSPMQESRYLMSVTVLKGYIYAMGGRRDDDVISHRTAERYQPNINQWTFIASMNEERIRASCTTLNNKIYICGGWSNRVLNTAEYYNPDTNQWTLITPMGTHRYKLGVVAYMVFKDIRRTNV